MEQYDSSTPPPSDAGSSSGPYGGPRSGFAGRGTRFFAWMRGLGIVRADGWLGGVCAGVAYRIGIDPIIVRGIVVVAAILGAPLLLLYAVAWALLPDREGRIHLQRLFEGEFESAMVGIGAFALIALLPWSAGPWWIDTSFWHLPIWGPGIGRALVTLIVLAAIAALVVGVVYSARGRRYADDRWTGRETPSSTRAQTPAGDAAAAAGSTPTASPASASPASASPSTVSSATASPGLDMSAAPSEPPPPAPTASPEDLADWQARHAAWAAEQAQWKQRLQADMRAVKAQRATELRLNSAAAAAEAAERRRAYRLANPRVGAAFGWATVGLALIAAALTAGLWPAVVGAAGWGLTAALAAATFVFGLAILAAGLGRRRSGFLLFLALLLAALTLVSASIPLDVPGMVAR